MFPEVKSKYLNRILRANLFYWLQWMHYFVIICVNKTVHSDKIKDRLNESEEINNIEIHDAFQLA